MWLALYRQSEICPAGVAAKLLERFFSGSQIPYEFLHRHNVAGPTIEAAKHLRDPVNDRDKRLSNHEGFRTLIQLSSSMAADLAFSYAGRAFISLIRFANILCGMAFLRNRHTLLI